MTSTIDLLITVNFLVLKGIYSVYVNHINDVPILQ